MKEEMSLSLREREIMKMGENPCQIVRLEHILDLFDCLLHSSEQNAALQLSRTIKCASGDDKWYDSLIIQIDLFGGMSNS